MWDFNNGKAKLLFLPMNIYIALIVAIETCQQMPLFTTFIGSRFSYLIQKKLLASLALKVSAAVRYLLLYQILMLMFLGSLFYCSHALPCIFLGSYCTFRI